MSSCFLPLNSLNDVEWKNLTRNVILPGPCIAPCCLLEVQHIGDVWLNIMKLPSLSAISESQGQQLDMPIYPIYQVPCKTKSWPNVTCCRELQLEPNTSLHVACFACTVEGIGNAHYFHERFWEWFFGDDLPPLAIYAKYIMSPPKKIMW